MAYALASAFGNARLTEAKPPLFSNRTVPANLLNPGEFGDGGIIAEFETPPMTPSFTTRHMFAFVAESIVSIENNSVYVSFLPSFKTTISSEEADAELPPPNVFPKISDKYVGLFPKKYPMPTASVSESVVPMLFRMISFPGKGVEDGTDICCF